MVSTSPALWWPMPTTGFPPPPGPPGSARRGRPTPKLVAASEIADGTDLIVTAHSHARISKEALAAAKLGGIGYHPSLLPRHRGIAAVEWTIREGDPIAGGTVFHLA